MFGGISDFVESLLTDRLLLRTQRSPRGIGVADLSTRLPLSGAKLWETVAGLAAMMARACWFSFTAIVSRSYGVKLQKWRRCASSASTLWRVLMTDCIISNKSIITENIDI